MELRLLIHFTDRYVEIQRGSTRWRLHNQWVDFYTILALKQEKGIDSGLVSAAELALSPPWSRKKTSSVGKEIARHIDHLDGRRLQVLSAPKKTSRWRLQIAPSQVQWLETKLHAESWFDELGANHQSRNGELNPFSRWLSAILCGMIRFEQGRFDLALIAFRVAHSRPPTSSNQAVSAYLLLKVAARLGVESVPVDSMEDLPGWVASALNARAETFQAFASEGEDLTATRGHLAKMAARLETGPDLQGLGLVYNAMGVTARRQARVAQARNLLETAICYLIPTQDLSTLQAAIFNLGHTHYLVANSDEALQEAIEVLKLDRLLYRLFAIGSGSAQAEVVLASAYIEKGEPELAEAWLQAGEQLAAASGNLYDQACLLRLRARLLWGETHGWSVPPPSTQSLAVEYLEKASVAYENAGLPSLTVERERQALELYRPVAWKKEETHANPTSGEADGDPHQH